MISKNEEQFRQAYDRITSHGWLDKHEAWLLWSTALRTTGPIVEVGSYMGRSAMLLAQLGRELTCVDPWDNKFSNDYDGDELLDRFWQNVNSLPCNINVKTVRRRVEEWEPTPADLVYLDGDHTAQGTRVQIQKALGCNPQFIAIHDIEEEGDGLHIKETAVELLGMYHYRANRLAIWDMRNSK